MRATMSGREICPLLMHLSIFLILWIRTKIRVQVSSEWLWWLLCQPIQPVTSCWKFLYAQTWKHIFFKSGLVTVRGGTLLNLNHGIWGTDTAPFMSQAMQIHDIYRETYNSRNVFCRFRKYPPGAGGGVCRRFTPAVKGGRLQWQDLRGLYRQDQISCGRGKAMVVLVLLHMKLQESSW